MAKLTDTQLIVLSTAAASADGAAVMPERMVKAAAMKVGASLVARKLVREIRTKPGMVVWREDETGRNLSLVITRAGRDVIGVEKDESLEASQAVDTAPTKGGRGAAHAKTARPVVGPDVPSVPTALLPPEYCHPREGSKQALIITMLRERSGVSLSALVEATGWLPHTTRAALTGLRKRGFTIELSKETTGSVYRIVDQSQAAA